MGWRRHLKRYSLHQRWTATRFQDTTLFLALAMWLCILPLLAIFALPFLGWKVTIYLAGFLLVADLVACWFLCIFRLPQKPEGGKS